MRLRTVLRTKISIMTFGVIIWVAYLVLYLLEPDRGNAYNLSYVALFFIKLTVALPVLAIWLTALFGANKFRRYANAISESPDGRALLTIANGLMVVVAGLISQTLLGTVLAYAADGSWIKLMVFIHNHLPVALSLIGFGIIFVGARGLAKMANLRLSAEYSFGLLLPYLVLGGIFMWYFYRHFEIVVTNGVPNFATSGAIAFWSIAVPSVITWLIGVLAICNIHEYANHVSGGIYRKALRDLVRGISLAVLFSVVLQLLALSTQFFAHLGLGPVLAIVYLLLVLYAAGFVFIARGAKKLMRIEVAI